MLFTVWGGGADEGAVNAACRVAGGWGDGTGRWAQHSQLCGRCRAPPPPPATRPRSPTSSLECLAGQQAGALLPAPPSTGGDVYVVRVASVIASAGGLLEMMTPLVLCSARRSFSHHPQPVRCTTGGAAAREGHYPLGPGRGGLALASTPACDALRLPTWARWAAAAAAWAADGVRWSSTAGWDLWWLWNHLSRTSPVSGSLPSPRPTPGPSRRLPGSRSDQSSKVLYMTYMIISGWQWNGINI